MVVPQIPGLGWQQQLSEEAVEYRTVNFEENKMDALFVFLTSSRFPCFHIPRLRPATVGNDEGDLGSSGTCFSQGDMTGPQDWSGGHQTAAVLPST